MMNSPTFLKKVDQQTSTCDADSLRLFIHEIARTIPECNENPNKGEEELDENGEPVSVDTRTGYYSDDIANTFCVPMEQHRWETEVTDMDSYVNIAMLTDPRKAHSEE